MEYSLWILWIVLQLATALCPHQQPNLLVASCETTSKIATLITAQLLSTY